MEFSDKQRRVLTWWCDASEWRDREAIICDGAVRSGKTLCLGLSFFLWAMGKFDGEQFALCARSMETVRRNLLHALTPKLRGLGMAVEERVSRGFLRVRFGGRENIFWLFGGKDESSAGSIQGITLAGALMDEVTLMPRSFVEQTAARCSVEGARLWFSCNPEGPEHWFYREWVCRAEERRALRVHFLMTDNPGISPETVERYGRYFQGMFYRRFVLGEWVPAEGRVYDFFTEDMARPLPQGEMEEWRISCDYGTVNPTSMGLWGRQGDTWYRMKEYYYDSQRTGMQKTDYEYVKELERLAAGRHIRRVVVDSSAASFIEALRREGWPVMEADREVLTGIRVTADMLRRGQLVICRPCVDAIREFSLYCWDREAQGDRVIKRFDHAMDDIRYFAMSLRDTGSYMGAFAVERPQWGM